MEDCIFCKIANKKLPCNLIYEDKEYLAFLDIFPRVKGHTLVIPKKHYRYVYDVDKFGEYWEVVKKIAIKIKKNLASEFVTFLTIGNEVPHAHIHILPQKSKNLEGIDINEVLAVERENIEQTTRLLKIKF